MSLYHALYQEVEAEALTLLMPGIRAKIPDSSDDEADNDDSEIPEPVEQERKVSMGREKVH